MYGTIDLDLLQSHNTIPMLKYLQNGALRYLVDNIIWPSHNRQTFRRFRKNFFLPQANK